MFTKIRTRLALALAVPLAALVALSALQVGATVGRLRSVATEQSLARAATAPQVLIAALQAERASATLAVLGRPQPSTPGTAALRASTSAALASFSAALSGSALARQDFAVATGSVRIALPTLRAAVDAAWAASNSGGQTGPAAQALSTQLFDRYTNLVDVLLTGTAQVSASVGDGTVRTGTEILDASVHQAEAKAATVQDVLAASGAAASDLRSYESWTARLRGLQTPRYAGPVTVLTAPSAAFRNAVQTALAGGGSPNQLAASLLAGAAAHDGAAAQVGQLTTDRASTQHRSAQLQLGLWGALAVASIVFGAVVVLRVSHSVTRPLVRLSAHAEELAAHRLAAAVDSILTGESPGEGQLPQPPSLHGRDEVASVARALVSVQDRALSLAVEQAALRHDMAEALTNLGRRNQNLLSRQLDYITSIERSEVDPDKLDQLFKLDHLATRMRRNAESLLVLGGGDSPRQWSAPVALTDVVRAALAEVEDFRRVQLGLLGDESVLGRVTSDVAHLVAELLENGLSYSPPHTDVRVEGGVDPGGYNLRIVDRGLGMDVDALTQANARLAGRDAFGGSPSRYLGLYVAGQLAQRHGIAVSLAPGSDGGTVATVRLPPEVLAGAGVVEAAAQSKARASEDAGPAAGLAGRIRPGTPAPEVASSLQGVPVGRSRMAPGRPTTRPSIVPSGADTAGSAVPAAPLESPAIAAPSRPPVPAGAGSTTARSDAVARRNDLLALLEREPSRRSRPRGTAAPTAPAHVAPSPAAAVPSARAAAPAATALAPAVPSAAGTPAPGVPAARPAPQPADEGADFEHWLDSRLEQLARLSVEQSVVAAPPRSTGERATAGIVDGGGDAELAGLPRRQRGSGVDGLSTGLRRREPGDVDPAPEAPRVSSSLFRYLSAVDGRSTDTTEEGPR